MTRTGEKQNCTGLQQVSRLLFNVFQGDPTGPPPLSNVSIKHFGTRDKWKPSPEGTWMDSRKWSEEDVFQAQLICTTNDNDNDDEKEEEFTIKVGKGGQLYSFNLPSIGEFLPPQNSDESAWTDDTFITTIYASKGMDGDPKLNEFGMNWLQNGYYLKGHMDPTLQKPFYEPVMAEHFDPVERSFSMINLRFTSMPSVNRSDVMMYTKFRCMGKGVLEITYYFYNFGEELIDAHTLPWGGVRTSKLPDHIIADADGSYRNVKNQSVEMRRAKKSGGWIGAAQDGDNPSSPAFAIVHGVDQYGKTPGYEFMIGKDGVLTRIANTGKKRDFTVIAQWNLSKIHPGQCYYFRTYMVTGSLEHVSRTGFKLVPEVDYNMVRIKEATAPKLPLYTKEVDGQTILTINHPEGCANPVAESYALPVKGSFPLLLMQESESGTFVLTTDPYCVCSKKKFPNPFPTKDPKHEQYNNREIYRPYDDRTRFIGLLGYVLPIVENNVKKDHLRLSTVLDRHGVRFAPGEMGKRRAFKLMIFSTVPTNEENVPSPPRFKKVRFEGQKAQQGSPYDSTVAGTAAGSNVTYSKVLGPRWLRVAPDGALSGVPTIQDPGRNTFSLCATDNAGNTDVATFFIDVESNINAYQMWNAPASEDWQFRMNVQGPSSDAYTDISKGHATISVPTKKIKGGNIANLCNGSGHSEAVFFPFREPNRILVDLGSVKPIKSIHTYAHNLQPKEQHYHLFVSDAEDAPSAGVKVRSADLEENGWFRLINFQTRSTKQRNCQSAVNLRPRRNGIITHARYLLFDLMGKGTKYVEIDVYIDDSAPLPAETLSGQLREVSNLTCEATRGSDSQVARMHEDDSLSGWEDVQLEFRCSRREKKPRLHFDKVASKEYWESERYGPEAIAGVDPNYEIVSEHNTPGTNAWKFKNISGPSTSAYSSRKMGHATISIPTRNTPQFGSSVDVLLKGTGAQGMGRKKQVITFKMNNPNRILVDLGSAQKIREVNTYSWKNVRTDHYYHVYYSAEASAPPASSDVRSFHLPKEGWFHLAKVQTKFERVKNSQIGTSIKAKDGADFVSARYILFDIGDTGMWLSALDIHVGDRPSEEQCVESTS